jgi:spermidine synthase
VLILGGGIQGIVRETLKHAPDRIDYVELNSRLFSIAVPLLPADLRQSLSAAPVRLHTDDPRRFLARQENYDLILIGMPEPDSGQTNRYYTLEFFRQCAARLMPGGIVAFRLRSSENIWTRQLTARAVSIYRSLRLALPQVLVLPGGADIYAASREPLPHEPALLAARLDTRGIETRLVSAPYIRYLYQNDRFARIAQTLATGTAPLNTDARPVCYSFTLMIWLSKFYPDLAGWDPSSLASWSNTHMAWLLAAGLAVAVLFLLSRRRAGMRRALFVGTAGFAGMVLETLFVLHYQVKSGVLYQDIGLLLMSFMAGLALGALALDRWASAHASRIPSWCGPLLAGSFAAISLAASARIRASSGGGMLETSVFLAATGFMVSAVLAYASLEGVRDQREVVAPLYASDLVGGCLGSFAGSLLLIPFAGMDTAAVLMAPLVLLSALLSRPGRMT